MTIQRRMRTSNAAARAVAPEPTRAKPVPRKNTVERGHALTTTAYERNNRGKKEVYSETEERNELLEETFSEEDPAAFVTMAAGITHNMGNYESLRIDCRVTIPVARSRLEEGFDYASNFIADRLATEEHNWLGKK